MTSLKKPNRFGILFLLFAFTITQCEKGTYSTKEKIDYTGHLETVFDIDSNSYMAFGIGTQIWMAQNLRVSRLSNGAKINLVTENNQWKSLNQPGYCWYNNDSIKNERFGALYNFFTVETGLICPTGWHAPTRNDWNILIKSLKGANVAGGKMKSYYSGFWSYPPDYSNPPGFSAMPGGFRSSVSNRQFISKDTSGYWWSSISDIDSGCYSTILKASSPVVYSSYLSRQNGLSIRCVKD
jgi:uncharacterized protein (TIGR02145 family)